MPMPWPNTATTSHRPPAPFSLAGWGESAAVLMLELKERGAGRSGGNAGGVFNCLVLAQLLVAHL